jgi:dihydrofolate synthase/folylpolyglutamate synthase
MPHVHVVVGPMPRDAFEGVAATAESRDAEVIEAARGVTVDLLTPSGSNTRSSIRLRTPLRDYGPLAIGLLGAHQIDNAITAARILETLDHRLLRVSPDAIAHGLAHVSWPGRLDRRTLADGREILLDAAHNPDGAAALAHFLRDAAGSEGPRPIVFAAMRDKDAAGMLRRLASVAGAFVLTRASSERSADPFLLSETAGIVAPGVRALVEPDLENALASAWHLSPRIVAAGSIVLLGDVIRIISALERS